MQERSVCKPGGCWRLTGVCVGLLLIGISAPGVASERAAFGFEQVAEQAQRLAQAPYEPAPKVPEAAADIERETWSRIDYRNDAALWHAENLPFEVQFFHAGSFYKRAVKINQITGQGVQPVPFSKAGFIYPKDGMREKLPKDIGYAGFRLHYPVTPDTGKGEVTTFLGASYFRALGAHQVYGLSGRGVAIDTALDDEEFPEFREFWLEKPAAGASEIIVYALLDGPSLTGAYRFVIRPGETTVMHVKSRLFIRKDIEKLGLAPLTSMFMFGESSVESNRDWRPEMHDSDGLLVVDGNGEWLWRPLVNPRNLASNSLLLNNPRGFGLIQKDRDFDHYQDLFDEYERRPNAWITPQGDWGRGHVELIQIPSDTEQTDNIVAFWVPAAEIEKGRQLSLEYRIHWSLERPDPPTVAQVHNTLVGEIPPHEQAPEKARRLAVDFAGSPFAQDDEEQTVYARINVGQGDEPGGKLMASNLRRNPHTGGWRLEFDVLPDEDDEAFELRAYLADKEGNPLTETWSYALNQ